jgi:hypothetical protein
MLIRGRCHCANISFSLLWEPDPVAVGARTCGCTFCIKHGGVWTSHPGGQLQILIREPAAVSMYEFGTRTAQFHVCARCGVVPVVTSRIEGRLYAVVNVNAFEAVDPSLIRSSSADFDGEQPGERLERRQRHWIGTVEYADADGPR